MYVMQERDEPKVQCIAGAAAMKAQMYVICKRHTCEAWKVEGVQNCPKFDRTLEALRHVPAPFVLCALGPTRKMRIKNSCFRIFFFLPILWSKQLDSTA